METIPIGHCFDWAYRRQKEGGTLVHGTITQPFSDPPHSHVHAWVEHKGKVYDWQGMEGGGGGNFRGKGYPKKVYYELYKPTEMKRYSRRETLINAARHKHYGPWDDLKESRADALIHNVLEGRANPLFLHGPDSAKAARRVAGFRQQVRAIGSDPNRMSLPPPSATSILGPTTRDPAKRRATMAGLQAGGDHYHSALHHLAADIHKKVFRKALKLGVVNKDFSPGPNHAGWEKSFNEPHPGGGWHDASEHGDVGALPSHVGEIEALHLHAIAKAAKPSSRYMAPEDVARYSSSAREKHEHIINSLHSALHGFMPEKKTTEQTLGEGRIIPQHLHGDDAGARFERRVAGMKQQVRASGQGPEDREIAPASNTSVFGPTPQNRAKRIATIAGLRSPDKETYDKATHVLTNSIHKKIFRRALKLGIVDKDFMPGPNHAGFMKSHSKQRHVHTDYLNWHDADEHGNAGSLPTSTGEAEAAHVATIAREAGSSASKELKHDNAKYHLRGEYVLAMKHMPISKDFLTSHSYLTNKPLNVKESADSLIHNSLSQSDKKKRKKERHPPAPGQSPDAMPGEGGYEISPLSGG